MGIPDPIRAELVRIFRAALDAVAPGQLIPGALDGSLPGAERVPSILSDARDIYLLAAGKASLRMAAALEPSVRPKLRGGVVVVPDRVPAHFEHESPPQIRYLKASHPIPDASSVNAARAALDLASRLGPGDLLLGAISGGASAMLAAPAGAITLADKIAVTSALLRAGASIRELNLVRKHISAIKGGRLLRAINPGASVLSLIISDVPSNDLATIASGLTASDPTTYGEAIGAMKRHLGLWGRTPESVREHLDLGAAGRIEETVKPGDPVLARVSNLIIGDNATALQGAARAATKLGYAVDQWRELKGEANDLGRALAAHCCAIGGERRCVLAGGEPVVTVTGRGRGGRAPQCALALALELARIGNVGGTARRIALLVAGTDGIDGPTSAAGAFAAPDTRERAAHRGLDAAAALKRNDSFEVFETIGDLLTTGPTGTNVADILIALVNY